MDGEIVTTKQEAEERKNTCWEAACESVPGTDKLQSQEVLLNPQELMIPGHNQMNLHKATSTHAINNGSYNSGHIQEGDGGYMPTKITGLHMHLQKHTDFLSIDPEATGTS